MLFLVPHSSHLTQPLDLGIFGRVKSLIRDDATYTVNIEEFDEALDDVVEVANRERRRAERGKILAEYIVAILDSYEKATTRRLLVSAFRQAGILYKIPDPQNPNKLVTYVDPTEARAVEKTTGLFIRWRQIPRPQRGQIRISNLISEEQTTEAPASEQSTRQTRHPASTSSPHPTPTMRPPPPATPPVLCAATSVPTPATHASFLTPTTPHQPHMAFQLFSNVIATHPHPQASRLHLQLTPAPASLQTTSVTRHQLYASTSVHRPPLRPPP